ncbi:MAG: tetratricopeptide repeat protein [Alphaproteobacteria bacterium]|nr:tetratricopeptide repeat protein [Alphaproteobacteria bacterium]
MNRAERRRQQKLAEQATRSGQDVATDLDAAVMQVLTGALQHHTAGSLADAETLYAEVLKAVPNQPDALHLMGVLKHQTGHDQEALELIGRALKIHPDFPEALNNLGNVLLALDRVADAAEHFLRALALNPEYADAHNNLGGVLLRQGKFTEALDHCRKAAELNPAHVDAHFNQGRALRELGRAEDAVAAFQKVVDLNPAHGDALTDLGQALNDLGRCDEAADALQKAVALEPDHALRWNILGVVLLAKGEHARAAEQFRKAAAIAPDFLDAHNNLGNMLLMLGRYDEAVTCFERAIALRPDIMGLYMNISLALRDAGRLDEAETYLRMVVGREPRNAVAFKELGTVLTYRDRLDEASTFFQQAITLEPDYGEARFELGLSQLLHGDFAHGWENYAWRRRMSAHPLMKRQYDKPLWDGGDLTGKTIYLYPEQGMGDTIQFVRFAKDVADRGGRVILETPKALEPLLRTVEGPNDVIVDSAAAPAFDCHASLMDLGGILRVTPENASGRAPYLRAPDSAMEAWSGRIANDETLRVGMVWGGNPNHKQDAIRSIPADMFSSFADIPGVSLYSLQVGRDGEAEQAFAGKIIDLAPFLTDFGQTAAAMMQLDLVIAVDTSAAHLAGALGRPVWTLVQKVPDWRWLREGSESYWYPTMRLFRQHKLDSWVEAVEDVRAALMRFAES